MKTMELLTYKRVQDPKKTDSKLKQLLNVTAVLASLAGIFTARVSFLGVMAPLGIAWYAANSGADATGMVLAAVAMGSMFMNVGVVKIKYVVALMIFALLRRFIPTKRWEKPGILYGTAAAVTFLCSIVTIQIKGFLYYDLIMAVLEAVGIVGFGVVFSRAASAIRRSGCYIDDEESIALAILAGCCVAGLQGLHILGVKLSNILSIYIILLAAYKGGCGISGAVGAALGLITGLSQGDVPAIIGVYAFVGLSSGVMRRFGKLGIAVGAAFANAAFAAYYNGSTIILVNVLEIAAAAILFYFTPNYLFETFERLTTKNSQYNPAQGHIMRHKQEAVDTMEDLKNAMRTLAEISGQALEPAANHKRRLEMMCERIAAKVCNGCSLNNYCWNQNYAATNDLFHTIMDKIQENGHVLYADLPDTVMGKCVRRDRLVEAAHGMYEIYKAENLCDCKADEYRGFAAGQFEKIAQVIDAHKAKLEDSYVVYEDLSLEASKALYRAGMNVKSTCAVKNRLGIYELSVEYLGNPSDKIEEVISHVFQREMVVIQEDVVGGSNVITLQEKEIYECEAAVVSTDRKGGEISGDSSSYFVSPEGFLYCILSDGMGSGQAAAEESNQVISLFEKLAHAGFELEDAVKMINGALVIGGGEEACITADIARINLRSGALELVKAGAVASMLTRGEECECLRWSSMPLGILDVDKVDTVHTVVSAPATLVMMTDGVPDNCGDRIKGEEYIKTVVELCSDMEPKEIADHIIMAALSRGKPKDDMTVLVVKINRKG